jgi:hypothetical protein
MEKHHALSTVMSGCLLAFSGNSLAGQVAKFDLPSGIHVQIVENAFKRDHFRLSGCGSTDSGCLINGRIPFGSYSDVPGTYVESITVSYQGHSYSLDGSDMYDAWGKRPLEHKGVIRYFGGQCADAKNCGFRGLFSDGVATRTVLTDSSDVVQLFMKESDPPDFD